MENGNRRGDPALLVLLGVVVALVTVAAIAVLTRGEPALRDAGTPEGVVQRYAAAAISGDLLAAEEYLSADARARCDRRIPVEPDDVRVALVSTDERAASATVRVTIMVSFGDPPFGVEESSSDGVFQLGREDERWRIETVPWQLETCANRATG